MTQKSFPTALDEVLGLVELAVAGIEQGQSAAQLLELEELLRQALVDIMRLIRRDPGIEAATCDLYGAAVALVRDSAAGAMPMARKLRLLREAHRRLLERLSSARPSDQTVKLAWREPTSKGEGQPDLPTALRSFSPEPWASSVDRRTN